MDVEMSLGGRTLEYETHHRKNIPLLLGGFEIIKCKGFTCFTSFCYDERSVGQRRPPITKRTQCQRGHNEQLRLEVQRSYSAALFRDVQKTVAERVSCLNLL